MGECTQYSMQGFYKQLLLLLLLLLLFSSYSRDSNLPSHTFRECPISRRQAASGRGFHRPANLTWSYYSLWVTMPFPSPKQFHSR